MKSILVAFSFALTLSSAFASQACRIHIANLQDRITPAQEFQIKSSFQKRGYELVNDGVYLEGDVTVDDLFPKQLSDTYNLKGFKVDKMMRKEEYDIAVGTIYSASHTVSLKVDQVIKRLQNGEQKPVSLIKLKAKTNLTQNGASFLDDVDFEEISALTALDLAKKIPKCRQLPIK